MSNARPESAQAPDAHDPVARGPNLLIHDRVVDIANQSSDRSEFLKLLAEELGDHFQASLVAVQSSEWATPLAWVPDTQNVVVMEQEFIGRLLAGATVNPATCDVPPNEAVCETGTRGLRVALCKDPDRAAVLLVYPHQPTPNRQIEDLRRLQIYAKSTRAVAAHLPMAETPPADQGQPRAVGKSLDRQSLRLFHLNLDLNETAYRIANESRHIISCDRVAVLIPRAGRLRVRAVSGVSVVDRRSNVVRSLERLAQAASVWSRPLMLPAEESLPPQIQSRLDDYLDESGVMCATILPLHAPAASDNTDEVDSMAIDPFDDRRRLIGVLVLEYFSASMPLTIGATSKSVAGEASLALRNSIEHKQVFGLSLWKSIGRMFDTGRVAWVAAGMLVLIAMLAGSMFFQIDHYAVATGTIEPKLRRDVFAGVDGIVTKVHVKDGQQVEAGELIAELENAELESRAEALLGDIQTAAERLAAIQAVRLSENAVDSSQSIRLALEQRQLESELVNLRAQQEILRAQQRDLDITSPIDGTVVGWQLQRRLMNRPVARGNLLVSVVDQTGPWALRLKVPDHNAGPVLESFKENPELNVRFAVATLPESTFSAKVTSVGTTARLDETGEHVIDLAADVHGRELHQPHGTDRFQPDSVRADADVTAKIGCGRRSVLRSWFSDLVDFTHRNILFYF